MTDTISERVADPRTYSTPTRYHELFTRLRRDDPVRWAAPSTTRPFWIVSKHADVVEIERQPELFINGPRLELFSLQQEERIWEATRGRLAVSRTMLHMDGGEHRAYRALTQQWFMPSNVKKLEEKVGLLAKEYVDKLGGAGGEVDFVQLIGELYPLRVIMTILGLPPEEAPELLRLTQSFLGRDASRGPHECKDDDIMVKAAGDIFEYFGRIYQDRLKSPRDDVATLIAHAKLDGKPIERLEVLSYYLLLGIAGHDTTNGTVTGGMLELIGNPDQLAQLKEQPDWMPSAVDEMLRWVTPVKSFMRTATQDYWLRGQQIQQTQAVLLCYWSANRDEDVFANPFEFRVDRSPNRHLAFGYGPHVCLGQYLAKMEIRLLFRELLPRLEHVRLAGEPQWSPGTTVVHLTHLPICYGLRPV